MSHPLPLKRQGEHPSDDGASAIKPSRLKIALPSEDPDKKVTSFLGVFGVLSFDQ